MGKRRSRNRGDKRNPRVDIKISREHGKVQKAWPVRKHNAISHLGRGEGGEGWIDGGKSLYV